MSITIISSKQKRLFEAERFARAAINRYKSQSYILDVLRNNYHFSEDDIQYVLEKISTER